MKKQFKTRFLFLLATLFIMIFVQAIMVQAWGTTGLQVSSSKLE